jgi:siroheme synthase-like protein
MPENPLYPIFLKLDQVKVLVVGGGAVAHEKLHFLLKSSPNANIRLVAREVIDEITEEIAASDAHVEIHIREFESSDLDDIQILLIATNDRHANAAIRNIAKERNILVNVADTPDLCDFYLGSIVTKGALKIGISTNGQSPTLAKRIREFLESAIPDEIETLISNLSVYRKTLSVDFNHKVKALNALTSSLIEPQTHHP